ncbi:hypothetical protein V6N13_105381 [Hibiscus sabdariffa]|uniref:Uncharacterized protein n=1 Tax=Hibiscus sabdariffa TaxID=183260 RepID=A0ABR2EWQ0_9ROSI
MAIKPSLSLIICSSLFASLLLFSYGTVSRKPQVREDGYGQDKAGLRGHRSNTAPSQVGRNTPPAAASDRLTSKTLSSQRNTFPCDSKMTIKKFSVCRPWKSLQKPFQSFFTPMNINMSVHVLDCVE